MALATASAAAAQPSWRVQRPPPPLTNPQQASSRESGKTGAQGSELALTEKDDNKRAKLTRRGEFAADSSGPSGSRHRRHRRSKREGDAAKKITVKDAGLRIALQSMGKLLLQTRRDVSLLQGVLLDTIILTSDSHIETEMKLEMTAIQAEARKRRQNAELSGDNSQRALPIGPPCRSLAIAWLEGLLKEDIGSGNKAQVQEILTRWLGLEALEMDEAIQECKLNRPNEKTSTTKLVIAMPRGPDRATLLAAHRSVQGVRVLVGQAPPGYLEDEVSEWVEALSL